MGFAAPTRVDGAAALVRAPALGSDDAIQDTLTDVHDGAPASDLHRTRAEGERRG